MIRGNHIIEAYQMKTGQEIIDRDLVPNSSMLMIDQLYEMADYWERKSNPYHPRAFAKARQIIHAKYPEEC